MDVRMRACGLNWFPDSKDKCGVLSMSLIFKQINENHPNARYYLGLSEYRRIEPDCVVAIFGRPCSASGHPRPGLVAGI